MSSTPAAAAWFKGNMDIDSASGMALPTRSNQIVLFFPLMAFPLMVGRCSAVGVRVTVISSISKPAANDRLRIAPSGRPTVFTDLVENKSKVGRDPMRASLPARAPVLMRQKILQLRSAGRSKQTG